MAADLHQRLQAASTFLLQSPPGEVNDVLSDVRTIVADDEALETGALPALSQYNAEQFIVVELEGKKVLITDASQFKTSGSDNPTRHVDPRSRQSFEFDQIKLTASNPEPIETDQETESIRSGIEKVLTSYVENHYADGVSAVYALEDSNYPEDTTPEAVPELTSLAEDGRAIDPIERAEQLVKEELETESQPVTGHEGEEAGEQDTEHRTPFPKNASDAVVDGDADAIEQAMAKEILAEKKQEQENSTPAEEAETAETAATSEEVTKKIAPRASRNFGLYFVGNKFNPSNYWTGRWRSIYSADFAKGTLEGIAKINVHYYEQGNVQLSTTLHSTTPLDSSNPSPEEIVAAIKKSETSFGNQLNEAFAGLSEEGFRGLRRALPKTKTKMNWNAVGNYKLGANLTGATEKA